MPNTDTTTTALTQALALVLQTASERARAADEAKLAAHAMPKGARGRKAALEKASDEARAAREQVDVIHAAIRQANAAKVQAHVDQALDQARRGSTLFDRICYAGSRRRGYRLERVSADVHVHVQLDDWGQPTRVEVRRLATVAETVAEAQRWLEKATDDETKALCQAIIDDPEAHPSHVFGASATISRSWRGNGWSINGSTWQVEADEDGEQMAAIHAAAFDILAVLRRSALPTAEQIRAMLDDVG
jgi:nitrate reductase assembly molybdenum cofactor insertion protein NarJ